jgi:hypothetical protein
MKTDPPELTQESPPNAADDPFIEECLQDALGPYMGVLSPEQVADYRDFLTIFLTTHPAAAPIYQSLRARRVANAASGKVPRGDAADRTPGADAPHDDAASAPRAADGTSRKRTP